jgi:hypothetical protein
MLEKRTVWLAVLPLLLACSRRDASTSTSTATTATDAGVPAAVSIPASATAPTAPAPPLELHEVAHAPSAFSFSALGPASIIRGADLAFRAQDGRFVQDPADAPLSRARSYGTYPAPVFAEVLIERAEMEPHVGAGKFDGKRLVTAFTPGEAESTVFLAEGKGGQWLAAVATGKPEWRFVNFTEKGGPAPESGPAGEGGCRAGFSPDDGLGEGDGTVVAVGFACVAGKASGKGKAVIARWKPDDKAPRLTTLDQVNPSFGKMLVVGRKGQRTFVAHENEPVLVGWDEATAKWAPIAVPGPIAALAEAPDGTLYLISSGQLFASKDLATFQLIPTAMGLDAVWVDDAGKLWLSSPRIPKPPVPPPAGAEKGAAEPPPPEPESPEARTLLTNAFAVPRVADLPTSAAVETGREEGFELGTDACPSLYVRVLGGVSKGQKFPTLPALVKKLDKTPIDFLIDETSKGKYALAAIVPDVKTGERLVAAIDGPPKPGAKHVRAPRTKVFCRVPVDQGKVTVAAPAP